MPSRSGNNAPGASSIASPSLFVDPPDWRHDSDRHAAWLHAQGWCVDPYDFPFSYLGAQQYARAHGVTRFSGREIARPADHELWMSLYPETDIDSLAGAPIALPARAYWPRWVATLTIAQELRELCREPIYLLHIWRPTEYNRERDGSTGSDHIECCAIDIRVESGRARSICLDRLGELYLADRLGLSIGWSSDGGSRRFHIGVLAPRTVHVGRQRDWDYAQGYRSWLADYARGKR